MREITILLFIMLCLPGCSDLGDESCLQQVQGKYPEAKEIKLVPDQSCSFLVNTGHEIRRVTVSWERIATDTKFMTLNQ